MKSAVYGKLGLATILASLAVCCNSYARSATTTCVSVASDGTPGNATSQRPAVSADGHRVAFESVASNLAPGVTNGKSQVYVHDRQTGQTICVSVTPDGSQGNDDSTTAAISGDGQFVAFHSVTTNLVPGGSSGVKQVFVRDCTAGTTTLVSVTPLGNEGNWVSLNPTLNADGRYVAFNSGATDLVPGISNGKSQVFVYDTGTKQIVCASLGTDGSQGDGDSYIATSVAMELVPLSSQRRTTWGPSRVASNSSMSATSGPARPHASASPRTVLRPTLLAALPPSALTAVSSASTHVPTISSLALPTATRTALCATGRAA